MNARKIKRMSADQLQQWQLAFAPNSYHAFRLQAEELIASSPYSLTHIAKCLGIGRTTLYRALERDPGLLSQHAILAGLRLLQV